MTNVKAQTSKKEAGLAFRHLNLVIWTFYLGIALKVPGEVRDSLIFDDWYYDKGNG